MYLRPKYSPSIFRLYWFCSMIRKIFKVRWTFLIISIIPYLKQIQDNLDYKIKKIKVLNTYIGRYLLLICDLIPSLLENGHNNVLSKTIQYLNVII